MQRALGKRRGGFAVKRTLPRSVGLRGRRHRPSDGARGSRPPSPAHLRMPDTLSITQRLCAAKNGHFSQNSPGEEGETFPELLCCTACHCRGAGCQSSASPQGRGSPALSPGLKLGTPGWYGASGENLGRETFRHGARPGTRHQLPLRAAPGYREDRRALSKCLKVGNTTEMGVGERKRAPGSRAAASSGAPHSPLLTHLHQSLIS